MSHDDGAGGPKRLAGAASELDPLRILSLLEDAPIGIVICDPDGAIRGVNAAFAEMLGVASSEIEGRNLRSLAHPDSPLDAKALESAATGGPPVRMESQYLHKNGDAVHCSNLVVPLPEGSGPRAAILLAEDHSAQIRKLRDLKRSEWRYRSLIENAPVLCVVLNAEGAFVTANSTVESILGYTAKELAGRDAFGMIHPEDLPAARQAWTNAMSHYGTTAGVEVRVRHMDGSWRTLACAGRNLLHNPVIAGIVAYARDITEQSEARRRIREFALETEQRNIDLLRKLSQLVAERDCNQLIAGLAEELSAPLIGMEELASLLLETRLDPAQRECAQIIIDTARNLSLLVRQMLGPDAEGPGTDPQA